MRKKKTVSLLSLFSIILVLALATSPIKAETENLTKTFYPTDDTYISEQQNTTNFGDEPVIKTRNNYGFANTSGWGWDALTKFNISAIPENSSVLSATLNLYLSQNTYYNQTNNKLTIYKINTTWDENKITWDNQPNYQKNPLKNKTITEQSNTWIKIDLTEDLKNIIKNNTSNNGWKITNNINWGHFDIPEYIFSSKENQNNTIKPYLEIKIKNHIPQPNFNYKLNITNKKINFTDTSIDPDGTIEKYLWEFGDGTTSNKKNVTHIYQNYGQYQVNLTVEDNQGTKIKTTKKIVLNSEEKIKKEIEEAFNITIAENFYADNYSEFYDPNEILTVEQTINDQHTTFLISVNNSLDNLFLWNIKQDYINIVKSKKGSLSQNIRIYNNTYQLDFKIKQNKTYWNYIQITDYCPHISNLTILREDNTTVSKCYIFRENEKIYIIDKNNTDYHVIYSNYTVNLNNETYGDKKNNSTKKETNKSNLPITFTMIFILTLTIVPIAIYSFNTRQNMNRYIQNGNKKIKEIDKFLKEK